MKMRTGAKKKAQPTIRHRASRRKRYHRRLLPLRRKTLSHRLGFPRLQGPLLSRLRCNSKKARGVLVQCGQGRDRRVLCARLLARCDRLLGRGRTLALLHRVASLHMARSSRHRGSRRHQRRRVLCRLLSPYHGPTRSKSSSHLQHRSMMSWRTQITTVSRRSSAKSLSLLRSWRGS